MPPVSHLFRANPLGYAATSPLRIKHYMQNGHEWREAPFLYPVNKSDLEVRAKANGDCDNYRFNIEDGDLLKLVDTKTEEGARRRSIIVYADLTEEDGDTTVAFHPDPGPNRFPTYFLPWRWNQITCLELGTEADFFFTSNLSGCSVFVSENPGDAMKPWAYHANAKAFSGRTLLSTRAPSGLANDDFAGSDPVELFEYLGNGGPLSFKGLRAPQTNRSIEYMDKLYQQARPRSHVPSKRLTKSSYDPAMLSNLAGRQDWAGHLVTVFGIRNTTGWRFHFQLSLKQYVASRVVGYAARVNPLP